MASSSDWLAEAQRASSATPDWITSLSGRAGFAAGMPFAGGEVVAEAAPVEPTEKEAPAIDVTARAFAEGEAAGRAAALSEAEQTVGAQRALRLAFRSLDQAAMDALAADLADTVLTLCRQVIDERTIDTDALTKRCHAAAMRIGVAADRCVLQLNPEDLAVIGEEALAGWEVRADPAIERGGLVLETPDGTVRDGPAEWRRAIAGALHP